MGCICSNLRFILICLIINYGDVVTKCFRMFTYLQYYTYILAKGKALLETNLEIIYDSSEKSKKSEEVK